jgi:hypothetical protein
MFIEAKDPERLVEEGDRGAIEDIPPKAVLGEVAPADEPPEAPKKSAGAL